KSLRWEGGIREPCMIRWPGVVPRGKTTSQPIITMDFFPTILNAVDAKAPQGRKLDGVDLVPFLRGKQPPFARTLFWRFKRGKVVRKAVRDGDMKMVWDNGKEELHNLSKDESEKRTCCRRPNQLPGSCERSWRLGRRKSPRRVCATLSR